MPFKSHGGKLEFSPWSNTNYLKEKTNKIRFINKLDLSLSIESSEGAFKEVDMIGKTLEWADKQGRHLVPNHYIEITCSM